MLAKFWPEKLEGRDHSEDLRVYGRIILEWILGKLGVKMWAGSMWLRIGPMAGCCEHGNEPSGSIKGGEFLD